MNIIISNNCSGGFADWLLGRPYSTPWVFHFMAANDMITMYESFNEMDFSKFEICARTEWNHSNPSYYWHSKVPNDFQTLVRYENNVEVLFPHVDIRDDSFKDTYLRRLRRFNDIEKNIIFLYQTYSGESDDVYFRFLNLPNKKILIDNKHDYHLNNYIPNLDYFTCDNFHQIFWYNLKTRSCGGLWKEYINNKI